MSDHSPKSIKMEEQPTKVQSADMEVGAWTEEREIVPGTRLLLGAQEIILLPEPSNHPDDPLNWSTVRRYRSYTIVCLYSFMVAVVALSTAVTYGALIVEFGTTAEYLNVGTAVSLLLIGMGNLIWNPLAGFSPISRLDSNVR